MRNSALVLAFSIGAFRLTRSPQGTRPALWEDSGPRTAFPVVALNCGWSTRHQAWAVARPGGLLLEFLPHRLPHYGHPWRSGQPGPVSFWPTLDSMSLSLLSMSGPVHCYFLCLFYPAQGSSLAHTGQIPGPGAVPLRVPDSRKTTQTLTLVVIWQVVSVELAVLEQSRDVHSRSLLSRGSGVFGGTLNSPSHCTFPGARFGNTLAPSTHLSRIEGLVASEQRTFQGCPKPCLERKGRAGRTLQTAAGNQLLLCLYSCQTSFHVHFFFFLERVFGPRSQGCCLASVGLRVLTWSWDLNQASAVCRTSIFPVSCLLHAPSFALLNGLSTVRDRRKD